MEILPEPPIETPNEPEKKSGDKETSKKKKKKTTRVPLPVEKPEAKDTDVQPEEENQKKGIFEEILAATAEETESEAAEEGEEAETAEATAPSLEIPELSSESPEEGDIDQNSGIIFTQPEERPGPWIAPEQSAEAPPASETVPSPENTAGGHIEARDILMTEGLDVPAPESASPEPSFETANGFRRPAPDEIVPEPAEYEPMDGEPLTAPQRRRMIDPNVRYGETEAALHHRAETVNPLTEADVADAYYRGRKQGIRRGVIAGGITGWWLGRRGKREAIKQAEQEVAKRDEEIDALKNDQAIAAERLASVERTQEFLKTGLDQPADYRSVIEVPPPIILNGEAFTGSTTAFNEQLVKPTQEVPAAKPEQAPEDQAVTEETYQAPAGRRVEMSAWHRMEVDERTGKLVENPEVVYGEEFKKEQKQELLQDMAAKEQLAPLVGHASLLAADGITPAKPAAPPPAKPAKPKKQRQSPIQFLKANQTYIKQQMVRRTTDTMTWLIAFGIVVVLIITGIL